ncbi:MAG: Tfx family DNA-binding protein [Halobacteriota archaeon]
MVEVPQDVSGTLLSERQVAVLKMRQDDESYEAIADELDTTPAGVQTLEQTALEHIQTAYRTVRVAESLRSSVHVRAEAGMTLLDVVRELRTAGDQVGVKLGDTEQRLHDELATLLEPVLRDTVLTEDVELTIDNDGAVALAKRQT